MRFLRCSLNLAAAAALLAACAGAAVAPPSPPAPTAETATLHFTYWGTDVERAAVDQTVRAFEAANPNITVNAEHIPNDEYMARLAAMFAAGDPPDVGYLLETHAALWASGGKVLDMTDVVRGDPLLAERLPETYYYYAPGKTIGTSTASETTLLFYNKDLFDQAGLPYPPSDPDEAWTWDEFLAAARRLTTDSAGRHPDEPDFDPNMINVYGVTLDDEWWAYYPFIYSNGGEIVNEDGTRLLLDSPEAVEAIQALADLMWVHHVAPTPIALQQLPTPDVLLQTGQLGMLIHGQWMLIDFASMDGLNYGVAVLPKLKEPKTMIFGSPTVIFAGTQHLEAAIQFYKYHNDPQVVDLFERGLWMPLDRAYYTEPAQIAAWLDNPAHPPEARGALVDYTLCCVVRDPHYYVKNFGPIDDEAIQPAIDRVWWNLATPAEAMAAAVAAAAPLMAGRWDQ
jgi:multiple sugar transport system substrate-binding protein